ncbi:MAG: ABC transporter ATP-binding protein [Bacillota bacterium]
MEILSVNNIKKHFGGLEVLKGTTMDVKKGTMVGLVGPNGSGKTTLLKIIFSMLKADAGNIYFKGQDITRLPPHRIYQQGLSFAFQLPRLFFRLPVMDNLILAGREQLGESLGGTLFLRPAWRRQEAQLAEKAWQLLDFLEMSSLARHMAGELSGGQRKLVEIGRALMADPAMMLLDEPAAGVNPVLGKKIYQKLRTLTGQGMTFLVVEHKLDMLLGFADWVYMIDNGKIMLSGTPREVIESPEFYTTYVGEKKDAAS